MNTTSKFRLRARDAFVASAAVAALGLLILAPEAVADSAVRAAASQKGNACRKSADKAFKSCQLDANDDVTLGQGVCLNFADRAERSACVRNAKAERKETLETCKESRKFRVELCKDLGPDPYDPPIDPGNFLSPAEVAAAPNPYLSLVPGTVRKYSGGGETTVVTVTSDTRVIQGVTTTVVSDVVSVGGRVVEDTHDYYAQDRQGNVWYFGERVLNYDEDGYLESLDGSFIAGIDGAKAGIAMKGAPQVGDKYRQEFALREAEDIAEVISLTADENTPVASCNGGCLLVEETQPLEPDVVEHKYYVAGIGFILAIDQEAGERAEELVEMIDP